MLRTDTLLKKMLKDRADKEGRTLEWMTNAAIEYFLSHATVVNTPPYQPKVPVLPGQITIDEGIEYVTMDGAKEADSATESEPWKTAGSDLPCCLNKKPCRHWVWDDTVIGYRNSLSGRITAPEDWGA